MNTPQLIHTPESVTGGAQYQQLGYLDAYDAVNNDDYAFVACKETDSSGSWRVRISGKQTPGAVFEPDAMKSNARSTGAQGKTWFPWGWSLDPGEGDVRGTFTAGHVREAHVEVFGDGFLNGVDGDLAAGLLADQVAQQVLDLVHGDGLACERCEGGYAHERAFEAADVGADFFREEIQHALIDADLPVE